MGRFGVSVATLAGLGLVFLYSLAQYRVLGLVTVASIVFAGLLTKVGVYAIIRAHSLLFPGGALDNVLMVAGVLTMIIGNVAAVMQSNVKRMLAYSSIAHAAASGSWKALPPLCLRR